MDRRIEGSAAAAPPGPPAGVPLAPRAALLAYRLASRLATPLLDLYLRTRLSRGKELGERLGERWGRPGLPRPVAPLLWLHGASVGELLSLLPLVERLRRERPGLALLVTSGTVTSARLAADRLPPGVLHQFAPLDHPLAVRRFLAHWRPQAGVFVESEIWPTLLLSARAAGVELALLNARLSQRSFDRWRRFPALARALFGCFGLIQAQSKADALRLGALLRQAVESGGNLKLAAPPLPATEETLAALAATLGKRPVWLAASTHPGEERLAAAAHRRLKADFPDLLTVIAPRHPERGPLLAAELSAEAKDGPRLAVARRAAGEPLLPETDLYLADTLGELGLLYRLVPIVFVGGSLVPHGGQNLLEPARLGAALLSGPHTENFTEIAAALEAAGALRRVADAASLAAAVALLLEEPERRCAMAEAAAGLARTQAAVLERALAALAPLLDRAQARA